MEVICGTEHISMEEVVNEYSTMLLRVAVMKMKNTPDAEEIVQETYFKLMKEIKKDKHFDSREHLKAWLLRVTANQGNSILTSVWNKRTEGMDSVGELSYEDKTEFDGNYAYNYVLKLPEKHRIAIQLFYYEQFKAEEIAHIMKTKPSTVRSYLLRGRQKLKEMMEADNYVG